MAAKTKKAWADDSIIRELNLLSESKTSTPMVSTAKRKNSKRNNSSIVGICSPMVLRKIKVCINAKVQLKFLYFLCESPIIKFMYIFRVKFRNSFKKRSAPQESIFSIKNFFFRETNFLQKFIYKSKNKFRFRPELKKIRLIDVHRSSSTMAEEVVIYYGSLKVMFYKVKFSGPLNLTISSLSVF